MTPLRLVDPTTTTAPEPTIANDPQRIEVHIPLATFIKVAAVLLTGYVIHTLWPLLILIFLATFLAVTLHAFVEWLEARGIGRRISHSIVITGTLIAIGLSMALIFPALINQTAAFTQNLPKLRADALTQLPPGTFIRTAVEAVIDSPHWSEASTWLGQFMSVGGIALSGISQITLLLVIALYLLIDGSKTYEWVLAFFSPSSRR